MRGTAPVTVLLVLAVACGDSGDSGPGEPMHSVRVSAAAGSIGGGVITSSPAGISCTINGTTSSGTCSAAFAPGTFLELTTVRNAGSRLREWSAPCSQGPTCFIAGLQADVTLTAAFEPATALVFDGVQRFAEIPDADALDVAATWTIEAWILPAPPGGGGIQHIVSKWGVTGAASYSFEMNGTELKLATSNGVDPTTVLIAPDALTVDAWQHVAVTFNNGAVILYVNGNPIAESLAMAIPMNSDKPLSFGREGPPFNGYYFKGILDEVRIWQVARTGDEVFGSMMQVIPSPQAGLVGYWRLDESGGQSIDDLSGSGNSGTLGATAGPEASDPVWSSNTSLADGP